MNQRNDGEQMENARMWSVVRCPVEIPSANVDSATLDWQGGKRCSKKKKNPQNKIPNPRP